MSDGISQIEIREELNQEIELWANVPSEHAQQWARDLLESLWGYCKRPAVFVDGRKLQVRKPKGWLFPDRPNREGVIHFVLIPGLLSYRKHPSMDHWVVWHDPTSTVIAPCDTKAEAKSLAIKIKKCARKAFKSSNPAEARSGLPRDFPTYLAAQVQARLRKKKSELNLATTGTYQKGEEKFERKVADTVGACKLPTALSKNPESEEELPVGKKKKAVASNKASKFKTAREMICNIFLENNKTRYTDKKIQEMVLEVFPKAKAVRNHLHYVSYIRCQINKGSFKKYPKPKSPILSWNKNRIIGKTVIKKKASKKKLVKKVNKKARSAKKESSAKSKTATA